MRIAVGSDHGGFKLKTELLKFLKASGHRPRDFGTFSEESCDYPVFAAAAAKAVASGRFPRGVLICRTGIGMVIAANKVRGVRAAVIHDEACAVSSRKHNDSNIAVFGSRFIKPDKAKKILKIWLKTRAAGGRHRRRVSQIERIK
ncbi:MAG: ribose 5-phosphate isomerase B [Candidatus Omnitrophica bacterium]|nr:ribose 5-phosphate isomerase B [Candidatus Omnitrophota bacterium]